MKDIIESMGMSLFGSFLGVLFVAFLVFLGLGWGWWGKIGESPDINRLTLRVKQSNTNPALPRILQPLLTDNLIPKEPANIRHLKPKPLCNLIPPDLNLPLTLILNILMFIFQS